MKTQINAKLIIRLVGTALIGALAGNTFAASPPSDTRSAVVKFADLNLDTPRGVAVLYKRIHIAAEEVCGASSEDKEFLEVAAAVKKCVNDSETRAIGAIPSAALQAYYSKKTGRSFPVLASN